VDFSDLSNTQRELLTALAESSARLAKVWSEALKKAKPTSWWDKYNLPAAAWITPQALLDKKDFSPLLARFQGLIDQAAKDLPELLRNGSDKDKVERIKDRWMKSYEKLVQEALGIPPKSDIERFLEQWNALMRPLSEGKSPQKAKAFPDLPAPMAFMRWFWPGDESSVSSIFTEWWQIHIRTIGSMFRPEGRRFPREFEDLMKRALDAQAAFWNSVSEFRQQVMSAAGKGMNKLINSVLESGVKSLTPETYTRFQKAWITSHGEAFADLFNTETFGAIAADTVQKALEAKREMDAVMAGTLSFWNVPTHQDLETLRNEVQTLREEVRRLSEQIDALKAIPAHQPETGT